MRSDSSRIANVLWLSFLSEIPCREGLIKLIFNLLHVVGTGLISIGFR